ncbi:unnamed protein product [Ostreobium quekettii]|uniref:CDC20/Fizzy WD40 domain-containing protein n=1 Tax=Ostreobium quekettii TaxID=121088 RepID=A0A8S1J5K2_9CHLO|nr:unnamed protein product [Ostreobium quekettii]
MKKGESNQDALRAVFRPRKPNQEDRRRYKSDRFIPCRTETDYDLAMARLSHDEPLYPAKPRRDAYTAALYHDLLGPAANMKLMRFCTDVAKRYLPWDGLWRWMGTPTKKPVASSVVSTAAYRVLDAPDVSCRGSMQLIDWGSTNKIAVALGTTVHALDVETDRVSSYLDKDDDNSDASHDVVTSVAWAPNGRQLAFGFAGGDVMIFDVEKATVVVQQILHHFVEIGCLAWKSNSVLSAGDTSGKIHNFDTRTCEVAHSLQPHSKPVVHLRWDTTGTTLASGGKDRKVVTSNLHSAEPLSTLDGHDAPVGGIAWSPHSPSVLATSSGRCLRFWNTHTGSLIRSHEAAAKVSCLEWSRHEQDVLGCLGEGLNEIAVWRYPSMGQNAVMRGHERRLLGVAVGPDGRCLCSLSADETLRLWRCFGRAPEARSAFLSSLR